MIRLVESSDQGSVEIDGIQFETIAPESAIVIPALKHLELSTPVAEFRFRVHNVSSVSQLFLLFGLMPRLQNANGEALKRDCIRDRTCRPRLENFRLLQPGDSAEHIIRGEFLRYQDKLIFGGWESSGGRWSFHDFVAGEYWLSIPYRVMRPDDSSRRYYSDEIWTLYQQIWEGHILTPAKKIEVVTG